MSALSWQEQLAHMIAESPAHDSQRRIAVVGAGHEWRGDDAAGMVVVRLLAQLTHGPSLWVCEAGSAPECCCDELLDFQPDLVLFVDAADMGADPGDVCLVDRQNIEMCGAHTHRFPLHLLANYLAAELSCPVHLLGIQPADVWLGAALSPNVRRSAEAAARTLAQILADHEGGDVR